MPAGALAVMDTIIAFPTRIRATIGILLVAYLVLWLKNACSV